MEKIIFCDGDGDLVAVAGVPDAVVSAPPVAVGLRDVDSTGANSQQHQSRGFEDIHHVRFEFKFELTDATVSKI